MVAPFTNVNGRVWGGTPSLSLRERGTGGVEENERGNIKNEVFNVHHKATPYSNVCLCTNFPRRQAALLALAMQTPMWEGAGDRSLKIA